MSKKRVHIDGNADTREWLVWDLDLIGCAAFASTEKEALAKVPRAVEGYTEFLRRHGGGDGTLGLEPGELVAGERLVGVDEGLFEADRGEASVEQIERTIELLGWSRDDLLATLETAPKAALKWDPSYRNYAPWAQWRTIEEILAHIAVCETRYYLRGIGRAPGPNPTTVGDPEQGSRAWYAELGRDWSALLARSREETVGFLREVARSSDRRRVHEEPGYSWSVHKVLRRLVWHELLHIKNIRRILLDFHRLKIG